MRAVVIAVVAVAALVVAMSLGADPEVALALPSVNGNAMGALHATPVDVREATTRELVPVLRHDTRIPNVLFVAAESVDDLMLGK